jgi:hypothetical protein
MDESRSAFSVATAVLARAQALAGVLHREDSQANALRLVEAAAGVKADADRLLVASVDDARRVGATWQAIGTTLGISRQAAYQRFGQAVDPRTGRPVVKNVPVETVERAKSVFHQAALGDVEAVCADFDDQMSAAMTPEALGETWASVLAAVGQLESMGDASAQRVNGMYVVDVPLEFEAGSMIGKVSFRETGEIAGLFILNAPPSPVAPAGDAG